MPRLFVLLALGFLSGLASAQTVPIPPAAGHKIAFERDIWPLLSDRCLSCHGEDDQQGQLRLDARAIVFRGSKSGPLFEPGKSDASLLIKRLVGIGGKRMPLDDDPLTDEQIGLIRSWIDQGADWPAGLGSPATEVNKHWAYIAPQEPVPPDVRNLGWSANAIDRFILARLERESISPAPPVEREGLIRRVSLDLIGIPPSVAEVDAFIADQAPDAYDRLIDRFFTSPRYGERWATPWLDAARYADSNGYQRDGHRTIWPYRDWVIKALNADMPFDQFTIEQLAGDLLPNATLEQQVATGFHRCTTVSVEAGTDEEENRVNQVLDRVNVTGTVWLGTTLECCQCHDHKYDPFTQRDYYQLFAFFNNTPKETFQRTKGSASLDFGGPEIKLPANPNLESQRRQLTADKERLEAELEQCISDEASGLNAWLEEVSDKEKAENAKLPANIRRMLAVAPDKRSKNQKTALRNYFISVHPTASKLQTEMTDLESRLQRYEAPTSLVMTEMAEARAATILQRGNFLSPGDSVSPAAPSILPPLPEGAPQDRLGLAAWLVSSENPLTARVQVNRAWAQFFGRGMVLSEEDFGSQAEPPSHPELLDWLAADFRDRGWSAKRLHRRIVESATYQQSSRFRHDLATRDPHNVLLARGPRVRLPAETIRDNVLAVSGRLSSKMLGPPVYPPQPEGIWRVTGLVDNTYRTSEGDDAWRRGVYTVWRRSAPYPSFISFDAPDRSACVVKRARSNTPLQALTLQNDPVYVEAAWSLARRVMQDASHKPLDEQLVYAFRTVLIRQPSPVEQSALRDVYQSSIARYAEDAAGLKELLGNQDFPAPQANAAAAWFSVAQVLLNLDETITKN